MFALPRTASKSVRHLSAYRVLRNFSELCGAEKPHLLTATKLKTQMLKTHNELNVGDRELINSVQFISFNFPKSGILILIIFAFYFINYLSLTIITLIKIAENLFQ